MHEDREPLSMNYDVWLAWEGSDVETVANLEFSQ
jgi:hypothetical protein